MMYSLTRSELTRFRQSVSVPSFTGAEMLMAAFRTDPEVVSSILPAPLTSAPDPVGFAFVARYPRTNFGCVYNEGALLLKAVLRGETGNYCLAMPVDDDMAMVGGREYFGFPKKIADQITLEKDNDRVVGSVVRKGTEILKIEAALEGPANGTELMPEVLGSDARGKLCLEMVSFLFKFFPGPNLASFHYLPRLVRQVTLFRPRPGLRMGTARVITRSSAHDPLGEIPVRSVLGCLYGTWDNTMLPGRLVRRIWNVHRFLPHAFFKTDLTSLVLAQQPQKGGCDTESVAVGGG